MKTIMNRIISVALVLAVVVSMASFIPVDASAAESWLWPVPSSTKISSVYGYRNRAPGQKGSNWHWGIDVSGKTSYAIVATRSGTVSTGNSGTSGYGNWVKINHNNEYHSLYAHMSKVVVRNGSTVKQGDIIGYMGTTGSSNGVHLHFEIAKGKTPKWGNNIEKGKGTTINPHPSALSYIYSLPAQKSTPAPQLKENSRVDGTFVVTIPADYTLNCFRNTTDTVKSALISAKPASYTIAATQRVAMSDGTTRFRISSDDGLEFYFILTKAMSVEDKTPVKVTFNANGGSVSPTSITVNRDGNYPTLPTPLRSDHTFNGWFTSATGGSRVNDGFKVTANGDHTLFAQWTVQQNKPTEPTPQQTPDPTPATDPTPTQEQTPPAEQTSAPDVTPASNPTLEPAPSPAPTPAPQKSIQKTQYRYHRYVNAAGSSAICPYYARYDSKHSNYGTISKIEYTPWLDAPLTVNNGQYNHYVHHYQGSTCAKQGCVSPHGNTNRVFYNGNAYWYMETRTITVQE